MYPDPKPCCCCEKKKSVWSVNGADLGSDTLKVESLVYLLNFSTSHQAAAHSQSTYIPRVSQCLSPRQNLDWSA